MTKSYARFGSALIAAGSKASAAKICLAGADVGPASRVRRSRQASAVASSISMPSSRWSAMPRSAADSHVASSRSPCPAIGSSTVHVSGSRARWARSFPRGSPGEVLAKLFALCRRQRLFIGPRRSADGIIGFTREHPKYSPAAVVPHATGKRTRHLLAPVDDFPGSAR